MVVKRLAPFVSAIKAAFWSRWERPVIILLAVLLVTSLFLNRTPNTPIPLPKVGDELRAYLNVRDRDQDSVLGKVTAVNGTAVTFVLSHHIKTDYSYLRYVIDWGKVYQTRYKTSPK